MLLQVQFLYHISLVPAPRRDSATYRKEGRQQGRR